MAERFTKLFTAQGDLYSEGSPVILRAGALLLDTLNTKALAQLKFQSISSKKILSLTVALQPQTSAGSALGDTVTHTYLDLSVERNAEFGSQTPIYLLDAETRAFVAHVAKVEFSDHTVWEAQEAKWAPLVFPTRTLEEVLQSPDAIEEYQRRFGMSANIMPEAVSDLWRCSCGALNHGDEKNCHRCTANLQEMCSVNAKELEQEHLYLEAISLMECGDDEFLNDAIEQFSSLGDYKDSQEKKATCEEMVVQNGINRKKAKKIRIIFGSIVAGIAACAAIICMGILPSVQINKATTLVDEGKDAQAMLYLDRSGSLAQSFRSSQYDTIKKGIYSRAVNDAKTLIEEGKYGEAYTLMTDRRCAWGDTYELAKALNDGDYQKAVNDYGMTHIIVPEGVTHLNAKAFQTCKTLLSVSLPSTLQEIGDYAFSGCSSLKEITIPDAVTKIDNSSFNGCNALTTVKISPNSNLQEIGKEAFMGCSKLASFSFPSKLKTISTEAFSLCSSLVTLSVPSNVTFIGEDAFYGCSQLTSITLPFIGESATSKAYDEFDYIFGSVPDSLTSVTITEGISQITTNAFKDCSKLTNIKIPASVTKIGSNAFQNCHALTNVYITGLESWLNIAFSNCFSNPLYYAPNLHINGEKLSGSVSIPENIATIPAYAFYNCNQITNISIPSSITSIGKESFANCSALTSVAIPDSVTSIGSAAFSGCSSLESITLPFIGNSKNASASDSTFGYIFGSSSYAGGYMINQHYAYSKAKAFYIPSSIKSVIIRDGNIPYGAFEGCSSLISVTLPTNATTISTSAFSGCSNLISATIPENITYLGAGAFSGCSKLTSVTIPEKVTTLGDSAFSGCTALSEINFNAASLPDRSPFAFNNAGQKSSGITVNIGASVTRIPARLFSSSNIISVNFATNSQCEYIGEWAFSECNTLTSIRIPQSVSFIGIYAFYETGLTSAIFEDTTTWEIYYWNILSDEIDSLKTSLSSTFFSSPSNVAQALAKDKDLGTYYSGNVWIKT